MWFAGYLLLATSTFCVALGFVPNQLSSTIHKLGIKPPSYIYDSDESGDTIIKHQSSSTVRSGSSNVSFNNGFDDVGYSKQSLSTKKSCTSIQIEADSDDSYSQQEFEEDMGEDVILSNSNMPTSSFTPSMSDLDILSGRSMVEENMQENVLMDNSEIISDMISSTMGADITLPTVSDQINMTEMEDIVEEMTETDTTSLSDIEEKLEMSNLINNGPILPMHNLPSFAGRPPGMSDVFPPNMMKPKIPGSMMNSITPSQSNMNYPTDYVPPSMRKPYQPYPSITSPGKMPPMKPHQPHPTGYIPPSMDLNSGPKFKNSPPGMGNQYNKPTSPVSEIPTSSPPYKQTPAMKKPYTPYQLSPPSSSTLPSMKKPYMPYPVLPPSMSTPPMQKPYGTYQYSSPPLMPTPSPKYESMMPFKGYPRTPRENPFLPPQMRKPQMPYLPTSTTESLTDLEYLTETWPQMNGFYPNLPTRNYHFMPGKNMPGMNTARWNKPGLNIPEMDLPGLNMPEMDLPGLNMPGMNTPRWNKPGFNMPEMDLPGLNMPGMNTPGWNKPGLNMPEMDLPGLNMPGMNTPGCNKPGLNIPEIDFPGLNMPGMNTPGWNKPGLNMPEMDLPGLNMPEMNIPGINTPSYIPRYPLDTFNDIDETSKYYFDTRNYDSPNGPFMKNVPLDFSYNQLDTLDSHYGLKYPYGPQPKKYPFSSNTNLYPLRSEEYPYITPKIPRQNLGTPFWPDFGAPHQKPLYSPTLDYPYSSPRMSNLPNYNYPKLTMPLGNGPFLPQYPFSSTTPGKYPKPWHLPKLPPGSSPGSYPQLLHPPKLPSSEIIPGSYPKPLHPPKLPPIEMINGNNLKPLHPPKFPPSNIIPGDHPHTVYPHSGAYPQDISYLIDEYPELYSYFDAILIYGNPATLIAAKELSDAGKRVLLISNGSYPPPESRNLYLRPQMFTQPKYVKTGPVNIPGAFSPKKFFYPTFLGGRSSVGFNGWDYGTKQKNQEWSNENPNWKWQNIFKLYDTIELTTGEIDAEGIIPVNKNLPRTQTIEYISSALQDLGLNDLGNEYSLRDQPGSMMLPVMAEEGPAGLQTIVLAEEVLEDMNNPENVFLCLNTEVENIDVLGDRAMGVTIKTPSGQKYSINAEDVIIGGNAGRIAQLLYKAGLGDESVLDQLQIPTQHHLPAVGKYLIVNPMFTGSFYTFPPGTLQELGTSDAEAKEEFLHGQYGIQPGILLDHFKAFISIQDGFESNVEINFYAFTISMIERLNALMDGLFQFDEETQMYIRNVLENNDILFALPQLMDTNSQGEVSINSRSDLNFPPTLESGMYTNPHDMMVMLEALKFVESLGATPTFQMLGANYMQISVDACMGHRSFEVYNECMIRNLSVPGLCSSGGAIMGTNSLNSVVNQNLQVHGMENLYIMNSAAIPNGANVDNAAVDSLIGEYGANFILRKNNLYL